LKYIERTGRSQKSGRRPILSDTRGITAVKQAGPEAATVKHTP
jgi:hypothetical protein